MTKSCSLAVHTCSIRAAQSSYISDLIRSSPVMANIYPSLEGRRPAPALLVPAFYFIFSFAPLLESRSARLSILVLLTTLSASSPCFAAKSLNEDYSRGLPSFALPIFFADLLLWSRPGDVRFFQRSGNDGSQTVEISEKNCQTPWRRFKWGFRMVTSFRLIGWNVQVKGVPQHHDKNLSRRDFTLKYLMLSGLSWVYKLACLYLIGIAVAGRANASSPNIIHFFDILEGWSGALWAAVGLNQYYQMAAAISVGIGVCDPWEWPPFFGNWVDGWSVRQIWR